MTLKHFLRDLHIGNPQYSHLSRPDYQLHIPDPISPTTSISESRFNPEETITEKTAKIHSRIETEEIPCGKTIRQVSGLIVGGTAGYRGQWPWLAAIYHNTENGVLKFICGGSLVSPNHVVGLVGSSLTGSLIHLSNLR